jgi:hypothetical protein
MDSATFNLRPVPPFRLDLTCWALRRRARNIVDRWYANSYRRVMIINGRSAGSRGLAVWLPCTPGPEAGTGSIKPELGALYVGNTARMIRSNGSG